VVSQTQAEVQAVFEAKAAAENAPLTFADAHYRAELAAGEADAAAGIQLLQVSRDGQPYLANVELGLLGDYQRLNLPGVLATLDELRRQGFDLPEAAVRRGLREVTQLTGLRGRWSILGQRPLVIADTGHNEAGIRLVVQQLRRLSYEKLHLVIGAVNDKDPSPVLALLPPEGIYYFCQAYIPRALPGEELAAKAQAVGLRGQNYGAVAAAVAAARAAAGPNDVVFIGGSTFVVAEVDF